MYKLKGQEEKISDSDLPRMRVTQCNFEVLCMSIPAA